MNPTEPLARFSARVQHATNGCWIWQGASVKGRGQIYVNGKNMLATRFAYQQFKGEIPEGMYVCHTCDDPSCVNPNHLWLGTARDNWQDARRKRRALQGIKREVCPQGHEYSGRECLTCRDARNKKRDHRAYRLAAQARRDAEVIALRTRVAELEAGEASKRGIMLAQASRLAELEGDLNVARLQLSARVCSECPARARLAELEADAARYRWLRDRNTGQDKIASARIVVDDGHPPCWELKHGDDLDRAIDAARLPGNKTEVLK